MDRKMIDCSFFMQGNCSKGDRCEFRHSEAAFKNNRPCAYWMQGTCSRRDCTFMHVGVPGMAAMGNMFFGGMPNPLFGMGMMGGMVPGQTPMEDASDNTAKSKAKRGEKDSTSNGTTKDQRVKPPPRNDKEAEREQGGKESASIISGKRKLPEQAIEANKASLAKIVKVAQQPQTPAQDQSIEASPKLSVREAALLRQKKLAEEYKRSGLNSSNSQPPSQKTQADKPVEKKQASIPSSPESTKIRQKQPTQQTTQVAGKESPSKQAANGKSVREAAIERQKKMLEEYRKSGMLTSPASQPTEQTPRASQPASSSSVKEQRKIPETKKQAIDSGSPKPRTKVFLVRPPTSKHKDETPKAETLEKSPEKPSGETGATEQTEDAGNDYIDDDYLQSMKELDDLLS